VQNFHDASRGFVVATFTDDLENLSDGFRVERCFGLVASKPLVVERGIAMAGNAVIREAAVEAARAAVCRASRALMRGFLVDLAEFKESVQRSRTKKPVMIVQHGGGPPVLVGMAPARPIWGHPDGSRTPIPFGVFRIAERQRVGRYGANAECALARPIACR
jgi:hypothetical protein